MMLLETKTAIVCGAGGAPGSAVARAFARESARVFLAGRVRPAVDEVARVIRGAGGTADVAPVDALDRAAVERLEAADATMLGRRPTLDQVVNVAVSLASDWAGTMTATEVKHHRWRGRRLMAGEDTP